MSNTRAAILSALHAQGQPNPEALLSDVERVADAMAIAEESGNPRIEGEFDPVADQAGDYQREFPAVWEFAIAGHHGGG